MAKVHPETYFNADTEVTALAFFDEQQLFAGTSQGTIQVWDLKSQNLTKTLSIFEEGHPILWLGQISESELIVQARFSRDVKILKDGKFSNVLSIPEAVNHFCKGDIFGNKIAMATGENKAAIITDLKVDILENDGSKSGNLGSLKISENIICLGFESGELKVFSLDSLHMISVINLTFSILSIDIDADKIVIGNCDDHITVLACLEDQIEVIKKRAFPAKGISSLKIRKDRKILAAGCWDGTVRIFSWMKPQNLKPLGALKFHEKAIEAVTCSNSNLIAAGSTDGFITIWKIYQ